MTNGTKLTGKALNAATEYARKANKRSGRRQVRAALKKVVE
jgi:hypothetical protein